MTGLSANCVVMVYAMLMLIVSLQTIVDERRREQKRLAGEERKGLGGGQGIKILPAPQVARAEVTPLQQEDGMYYIPVNLPLFNGCRAAFEATSVTAAEATAAFSNALHPAPPRSHLYPADVDASGNPVLGKTLNHPKKLVMEGLPGMMGDECEDGAALVRWFDNDYDDILTEREEKELQYRMIEKRVLETMQRRRLAALD